MDEVAQIKELLQACEAGILDIDGEILDAEARQCTLEEEATRLESLLDYLEIS